MSVEEARQAVYGTVDVSYGRDHAFRIIDRLILEVKAEMLCYVAWDQEFVPEEEKWGFPCGECPACEAWLALSKVRA